MGKENYQMAGAQGLSQQLQLETTERNPAGLKQGEGITHVTVTNFSKEFQTGRLLLQSQNDKDIWLLF